MLVQNWRRLRVLLLIFFIFNTAVLAGYATVFTCYWLSKQCMDHLKRHLFFLKNNITPQFKTRVSGAICKTDTGWKASMWVHFRDTSAWGDLLSANWWMVGFPCGKCRFTSNLFHLFWSNYQPRCLWLVDYLCPASLAASPDRHTAISHFTIWT